MGSLIHLDTPPVYGLTRQAIKEIKLLNFKKAQLEKGLRGMAYLGRNSAECSLCADWEIKLEEIANRLWEIENDDPSCWEAE